MESFINNYTNIIVPVFLGSFSGILGYHFYYTQRLTFLEKKIILINEKFCNIDKMNFLYYKILNNICNTLESNEDTNTESNEDTNEDSNKESNEDSNENSNKESNKESNENSNKDSNENSNKESNEDSNKESNEENDYLNTTIEYYAYLDNIDDENQ